MNRCPAGHPTVAFAGDRFCNECGAALVAPLLCECGRELTPGVDRFCPKCGRPGPGETAAMRRCAATGEGRAATC